MSERVCVRVPGVGGGLVCNHILEHQQLSLAPHARFVDRGPALNLDGHRRRPEEALGLGLGLGFRV